MAKPTYDKPPVTISDQLDILEEKGMVITDMAFQKRPRIFIFGDRNRRRDDKRKNTYLGFPDDWHSDKGVW